jgi:hypothetical protein
MRISISRQDIQQMGVLFLSMCMFVSFFTSCSDSDSSTELTDDAALISQIEAADKIVIDASSLPSVTSITFNGDFADSFVKEVQLAVGLGYKVDLMTDNESREEANSDVFFSTEGRALKDNKDSAKGKRHKCFQFVFPIDFIMPDNSSITLNSKEDWAVLKDWYAVNIDATTRPELVFPVDVAFKDGAVQTLINRDELRSVKDACKKGKDRKKCFKLVLPVSFTMADASVIIVNKKADFRLVKKWYIDNPTIEEKGVLNFPVDIIYRDQTTITINNTDEMHSAKVACQN